MKVVQQDLKVQCALELKQEIVSTKEILLRNQIFHEPLPGKDPFQGIKTEKKSKDDIVLVVQDDSVTKVIEDDNNSTVDVSHEDQDSAETTTGDKAVEDVGSTLSEEVVVETVKQEDIDNNQEVATSITGR